MGSRACGESAPWGVVMRASWGGCLALMLCLATPALGQPEAPAAGEAARILPVDGAIARQEARVILADPMYKRAFIEGSSEEASGDVLERFLAGLASLPGAWRAVIVVLCVGVLGAFGLQVAGLGRRIWWRSQGRPVSLPSAPPAASDSPWRARARSSLGAGRYREALSAILREAVLRLEGVGALPSGRHLTNTELAHRASGEGATPFGRLVRRIEAPLYGGRDAQEADVHGAFEELAAIEVGAQDPGEAP